MLNGENMVRTSLVNEADSLVMKGPYEDGARHFFNNVYCRAFVKGRKHQGNNVDYHR